MHLPAAARRSNYSPLPIERAHERCFHGKRTLTRPFTPHNSPRPPSPPVQYRRQQIIVAVPVKRPPIIRKHPGDQPRAFGRAAAARGGMSLCPRRLLPHHKSRHYGVCPFLAPQPFDGRSRPFFRRRRSSAPHSCRILSRSSTLPSPLVISASFTRLLPPAALRPYWRLLASPHRDCTFARSGQRGATLRAANRCISPMALLAQHDAVDPGTVTTPC